MKGKQSLSSFKPLSLAQYFAPPEEHTGLFGAVCGYSADTNFMDLAVEQFTGLTYHGREVDGRVSLILMLDRGNPNVKVPAVYHPGRLPNKHQPFKLLHSKIAVLVYKHLNIPDSHHIRVL